MTIKPYLHIPRNSMGHQWVQPVYSIDQINQARQEVIDDVVKLLKGIDLTELDSEEGWWETSTGAKRGKQILEEIKKLNELPTRP